MTNLKLITTETFGDLSCNFYRNMNDDILLTREQIGQALEYKRPDDAIYRIHKRHQDRLDNLSICLSDGLGHDLYYYTEKGIMEICRWSNSKRANEFMDWVWNVIEAYRHNELSSQIDITPLTEVIATLSQSMAQIQQDITTLKEQSHQKKSLPIKIHSRWKTNTFDKLKLLTDYVNEHSDQELTLSDTLHITINEMQDTYCIELSDYTRDYMLENSLETKPYSLDVINYYKDIRNMYATTLDGILEKLNLTSEIISKRNIFDKLAENLI